MKYILALLLTFTVSHFLSSQDLIKDKALKKILDLPDKEAIKARIKYLADDALRGRKPGTPGFQMAVDYVIDQFKQIGVAPKGDDGYLQRVVLRTAKVDTTKVTFVMNDKPFRFGTEVVIMPNLNHAESNAEAEVVFVGMGIAAEHLGHNDYADVNVKGKIVMMVPEVPDKFSDMEKAHFSSMAVRAEAAAAKGAVGVIAIVKDKVRYKAAVEGAKAGTQGIVNKNGTVSSSRVPNHTNIKFYAVGSDTIFRPMVKNLKQGDLIGRAKVEAASTFIDVASHNVVGWIPGSDPKLKSEFVVHSAHLDHLGIRAKVNGDSIYNGAHDNASGVACALEIAKLYKQAKLKRSVIIALVTAEEMGTLGSSFFAANPPVEKAKLVANINTDMPTLLAPLLSIVPHGAMNSTMINELAQAANYLHIEIQQDWEPEQRRIVRSDQYSFIKEGIPAIHVKPGLKTIDPSIDMKKKIEGWIKEHYHKPSDEYRDNAFDWGAAVTYVKLNFLIGYQIANAKNKPQWNTGDFFGETFGKQK